jgi:hypothetical protein
MSENEVPNRTARELDEHHQYSRTNIQLIVQWFIFFVTANYVVLGLFASKVVDGTMKSAVPILISTGLFSVVNGVSIWFCLQARAWFRRTDKQVVELRKQPKGTESNSGKQAVSPFPHMDYSRVMSAMALTIFAMLLTWIAFAVTSAWGIGLGNPGTGLDLYLE